MDFQTEIELQVIRALFRWTFFVSIILGAGQLYAHGAPPLATHFHSISESQWLLSTNFGIIRSDSPTRYICEEAFWGATPFSILPVSDSQWLIVNRNTILHTHDGCTFEKLHTTSSTIIDATLHPPSKTMAYITHDAQKPMLWVSRNAGIHFESVPLTRDDLRLTSVVLLDADTLLLSAYANQEDERGHAVFMGISLKDSHVSILQLKTTYKYPYLLANDGSHIVWHARSNDKTVVYIGTLEDLDANGIEIESWPTGAVVITHENDKTAWVSGIHAGSRGLMKMDIMTGSASDAWEVVDSDTSAHCVGIFNKELHICTHRQREGYDLSRFTSDGDLVGRIDFRELDGPVADCPQGSDTATLCPLVWPELARYLGIVLTEVEQEGDSDVYEPSDNHEGSSDNQNGYEYRENESHTPENHSHCAMAPLRNGHSFPPILTHVMILLALVIARLTCRNYSNLPRQRLSR